MLRHNQSTWPISSHSGHFYSSCVVWCS